MSSTGTKADDRRREQPGLQQLSEDGGLALGLIALAAISSPISQLTLQPVYGAIPSGINHKVAIAVTLLLGFVLHAGLKKAGRGSIRTWLPLIAAVVPIAEYFAILLSAQLGIVRGPVLAGLISCHAIIMPSAYAAAEIMDTLGIGELFSTIPPALINASIALLPFTLLERFFAFQLPEIISHSTLLIPVNLQLIVSAAYVLLCSPGPVLVVSTWILLISTYLVNPHGNGPYATTLLNRTLAAQDWVLLTRQWSTTGYISVLESHKDQYRVLRCDHSLLGGEWLLNDERRAQGWTGNEPTYSVFSMLEAVRLMDTGVADADARALVIGLGVGTAPKAMLQHGIETTIVELDSAIHDYAVQFFDLPDNHTSIIQDAVSWTQQQARLDDFDKPQFDYIIHDVFTGGAEPLPLFTTSFLADLRALLKPHGVTAINYAGDLNMPLTAKVLNTIDLAFDQQCEVYSDEAARKDGSVEPFSNFIVFCRNTPGEISFREPKASDYLGSISKRSYLLPKPDQRIAKSWSVHGELHAKDLGRWRSAQEQSATKHWRVMRTVLPAKVWELY
ncbi:hypothetical protein AMS68_001191 [Peltaster fructicola]|uniref:PABS domain-containing protein n=1 Tax=Peltaster fructicola TaxID=286661 RepID=A0A6H0XLS2_9PEZI|nr:hypothetical protein AMS68_001191 [Peltaster fructicola]